MGSGESKTGPSDGKHLNVRRLQKCARMAYLGARRDGKNSVDSGEGC